MRLKRAIRRRLEREYFIDTLKANGVSRVLRRTIWKASRHLSSRHYRIGHVFTCAALDLWRELHPRPKKESDPVIV